MPHLDEGLIHALLDGEVPSAELPPIQAHLGACETCRARLAEEQELLATSDRLIELIEVPPAVKPAVPKRAVPVRRTWPRNVAWAATLVVAAGLGYSARGGGPGKVPNRVVVPETTFIVRTAEPAPSEERAGAPAERRQARVEGTTGRGAAAKSSADAALAAAPTPAPKVESPPAPPAASLAPTAQRGMTARRMAATANRLEDVVVTSSAQAEVKLGSASPLTLKEAVRQLGGTLRLIDGLVPERLEALGTEVRVVYLTGFGELVLAQQLTNGRLRSFLIVPPAFPPDSVEILRARVRE